MIPTKRTIFHLVLLLFLSTGVVVAVNAMPNIGIQLRLEPPSFPISQNLFGMHLHYAATVPPHHMDPPITTKTPWPAVPFGGWRLWDAYIAWPSLEPKKGEWNFEVLDNAVALAEEKGVEVLLPLALTPTWASARPTERSTYGRGLAAEPKNIEDWRNYVRTVATRYKGRIRYYELWNEPNRKGVYTGSLEDLLRLFQEAYQILKEVDPLNIVVGPATSNDRFDGVSWLDKYLESGGGNYTDIISYHFYVGADLPPEKMVTIINRVQDVKAKYGYSEKPLWNTEAGWPHGKTFSDDEAAAYVARAYILNWAAGISRFYWYAWDNHTWVSLYMVEQADRKTVKPAAIAYQEVQKWLVGKQMDRCQLDRSDIWTCQLSGQGNYRAWILWHPDGPKSFRLPWNWQVNQVRDLAGNKRSRSGDRIEIGPSPLLLEHFNS